MDLSLPFCHAILILFLTLDDTMHEYIQGGLFLVFYSVYSESGTGFRGEEIEVNLSGKYFKSAFSLPSGQRHCSYLSYAHVVTHTTDQGHSALLCSISLPLTCLFSLLVSCRFTVLLFHLIMYLSLNFFRSSHR